MPSSHWGDWGFGAQYLLGCTGSHQLFPGLLAKHWDAGTLTEVQGWLWDGLGCWGRLGGRQPVQGLWQGAE